jgi:hypothetical protein
VSVGRYPTRFTPRGSQTLPDGTAASPVAVSLQTQLPRDSMFGNEFLMPQLHPLRL